MGVLTLADYQGYVEDLGVPDLESSVLTQCLNLAQQQICGSRLWHFRLTDTTVTDGSATISNVGRIHSAYYTSAGTQVTIPRIDKRRLQDEGVDLTTTATSPMYYYLDKGTASGGEIPLTAKSYPLATFTLRTYASPTAMSSSTDVSILPDSMQMCLVYQAGGHAFARVGILDLSQQYFNLAKDSLDAFDAHYNNNFIEQSPLVYPDQEP